MALINWIGIFFCLSQSAMLSGLNLALFSLSKLELNVEAKKQNSGAKHILYFRENANFALVTILWGNVGVNVLLALLSGSVLSGLGAFFFSTVVITVFAEIIPQAWFSRQALRVVPVLSPILRFYQIILYPIARPTAWILNSWLGGEEIRYFRERDLRWVIKFHMEASENEIERMEGQGALNFLDIDDVPLFEEGQSVDLESIIQVEFDGDRALFPEIVPSIEDELLQKINRSGKSWVIIVDPGNEPRLALNANSFLREALFGPYGFNPYRHCHKPIIVRDENKKLGDLIPRFRVSSRNVGDDIVEDDVILLWSSQRRIITGTDIIGRLLRDIARPVTAA